MQDQAQSSIRPVSTDDLESILKIENSVHLAPWTENHFRAEWEKPYSRTWVLTDDETDSIILGYAVFWIMDGAVELLNLAVPLELRGLGYAKKIMRSIITEGLRQGADRLILDVRKSNLPAVSLYQKVGLSILQVRKGFYSNGEDAYHMELKFEGLPIDF